MSAPAYPYLLQKYLQDTGWPLPNSPAVATRMQMALAFLNKHFSDWILQPVEHPLGPNRFQFKINGRVTELTATMQAIDFNHDVQETVLRPGQWLRRYGRPSDPRGVPSGGKWYTWPDVPMAKLALPPGQTSPFGYEVITAAAALVCTAGDMLVDWAPTANAPSAPRVGTDYHYRDGGGVQIMVPNAKTVLRAL
jgi:hypothetical protein